MMHGLTSSVLSAVIVILVWSCATRAYTYVMYDDSAPVIFQSFKVEKTEIQHGESLRYSAVYDKRSDCHPPAGTGAVSHRFLPMDGNSGDGRIIFDTSQRSRTANWPAGKDLTAHGTIDVPPDLPPGTYLVTRTGRYECARATKELFASPPQFMISIRPKG